MHLSDRTRGSAPVVSLVSVIVPHWAGTIAHHLPVGLLYVGGALLDQGYDAELYHIPYTHIQQTAEAIVCSKPLLVGMTVLSGGITAYSIELARAIKQRASIPIVWGGPHPSLDPEQTLRDVSVDYVVIGEGEETIVELADALAGNADLSAIKGLGYKLCGEPIINPPRAMSKTLDKYRMAWELVTLERYISMSVHLTKSVKCTKPVTLSSSRGCPLSCKFCYSPLLNNRQWRAHSVGYLAEEVERVKQLAGATGVNFIDDNFLVQRDRAFAVDEAIKVPWTCMAPIDLLDQRMVDRLAQSNCRGILIGIESGSDRMLRLMSKLQSQSQILERVKALSVLSSCHLIASLVLGSPTETESEIEETIDLTLAMVRLHPAIIPRANIFVPIIGSEFFDLAKQGGFVPPASLEGWSVLDRRRIDRAQMPWLPWLTAKKARWLDCVLIYIHILGLRACLRTDRWGPKRIAAVLAYHAAYFRLSHRLFMFPVEAWLFKCWITFVDWRWRKHHAVSIKQFGLSAGRVAARPGQHMTDEKPVDLSPAVSL